MNCPGCQRPIREGAQFCTLCGSHISYDVDGDDYDEPNLEIDDGIYVDHDDYALEAVDEDHDDRILQSSEDDDVHEDGGGSQELEAILARLTQREPEEPVDSALGSDEREEAFVLGESSDSLSGIEGPFTLGSNDDSGPIPVSAEDIEQTHRERNRTANGEEKTPMREVVRGWLLSARARSKSLNIPRQWILGVLAALLVFGVGYAFLSGDGDSSDPAAEDEGGLSVSTGVENAAAQPVQPAADAMAKLLGENEEGGAEFQVIEPEDAHGGSASAPESDGFDVDENPANALSSSVIALSTKAKAIPRACVLRDGPASKFRLVVSLVPRGTEVLLLAKSESNWKTVTQGERSGWAKGCKNAKDCDIRRGPGEGFKRVTGPEDSVKPRRPVTSSARWSYLKVGDDYGWTGPACWK